MRAPPLEVNSGSAMVLSLVFILHVTMTLHFSCLCLIINNIYNQIKNFYTDGFYDPPGHLTFFKTFMANIFPELAPATFRTWKTCKHKARSLKLIQLLYSWSHDDMHSFPPEKLV